MIDIVNTSSQGFVFLETFIFGFLSGFLIIINRSIIKRLKNRVIIFFVDFISEILITAVFILSNILIELGQFHFYTMIGFVLGILVFLKMNSLLRPYTDKLLFPVKKFFSKPIGFIMKIIKK
jgi:hypothetical protein